MKESLPIYYTVISDSQLVRRLWIITITINDLQLAVNHDELYNIHLLIITVDRHHDYVAMLVGGFKHVEHNHFTNHQP